MRAFALLRRAARCQVGDARRFVIILPLSQGAKGSKSLGAGAELKTKELSARAPCDDDGDDVYDDESDF